MNTICNLPYSEAAIDKFGNLVDPQCLDRIVVAENLFAICHGWNSDIDSARDLYENFFHQFCRTLEAYGAPGITAQRCAVLGILWPSEKFADPALTPGGAAGLGLRRATTYRLMKNRAGIIGRGALALTLDRLQDDYPGTRIHLLGHSFGARAITAAAAAIAQPVASMTLLQAAFSQNAFSPRGAFRKLVTGRKFGGPMLITHSVHDEALGVCYPLASRILRQRASGLGVPSDVYGALGRNGAVHTPEASFGDLHAEGAPYSFEAGRIYNLRSDSVIRAHADIVKPEIAWALIAAAGLGRS